MPRTLKVRGTSKKNNLIETSTSFPTAAYTSELFYPVIHLLLAQDRSEPFACHSEHIRFTQYKLREESHCLVQGKLC